MRHLITAAAVAAALALAACGSSSTSGPASTGGTAASVPPASCRALYEAWKHGPAQAPGRALVADLRAIQPPSTSADLPHVVAALKRAGRAAASTATHPMPHCADPHGYWPAILTRLRSAADNARSGSGLGGVMPAIVLLKEIPALERKLGAELKQTTHLGTPLS